MSAALPRKLQHSSTIRLGVSLSEDNPGNRGAVPWSLRLEKQPDDTPGNRQHNPVVPISPTPKQRYA